MAQHCLSGAISLGFSCSTSASYQIWSSEIHTRMAALSVVSDAAHQQTPLAGANDRKCGIAAFLRPDVSLFKGASRFLPSMLAAAPRKVPWLHLKAFRPQPPLKALNVRSSRLRSKKVRQEDAPSGDDIPAMDLNPAETSALPNTEISSDISAEKVTAGSVDCMGSSKASTRKSGVASPSPSSHTKQTNEPTSARRRSRKSRQDNGGATDAAKMFYVKDHEGDIDYLGESTKGDLNVRHDMTDALGAFFTPSGSQLGWPLSLRDSEEVRTTFGGPIEEVARAEVKEAEALLEELDIRMRFPQGIAPRGIFCSRTLSLRSITTIGYDMDYTLIHYNVAAWEGRAYDYGMDNLRNMGYPVDGLKFDPELVIRGLVMDKEKGNLVKADRFGYVKRAMHGIKMLSNRAISELYGRELVDLRNEDRWVFLNTLFSVSEAVMYMQMVERLDEGALPPELGSLDYQGLYKVVAKALFRAHVEGKLKEEITNEPERFVEPDPELPLTLLDQKEAGKRLILITNSDYHYTNKMMQFAFNQYLPDGMDWRALFDMVIVSARKPEFFQRFHPLYEVVTEDGLMRLCDRASPGGLYCGGSAQMVEKALGFHGDETLYVGDHIYTDVSQSKLHLRWRTALICRELEKEVEALAHGRDHRAKLIQLMTQKEVVGDLFNQFRLALQRRTLGHSAQTVQATEMDEREIGESMQKLLVIMRRLDQKIAPMLEADGSYFNDRWGYLSRAGLWDKSHLTRQIEKYADIYTSRVSNFLRYTPFMYFRSQSQTLAHDCQYGVETRPSEQPRHSTCGYQAEMPLNGELK